MNIYVKRFLHRGAIFAGFGPIVAGIVLLSLSLGGVDVRISGYSAFVAIISTYALAFINAGASVFNQIEHWSVARSLFFHFLTLYISYVSCYLINSWIPFEPIVILIFTAAFAAAYLAVWLIVFFAVRSVSRKMNARLKGG